MRLGRDTGVAWMALRLASVRPREARYASAIFRASASESRAPGASSRSTDRKPTSSPSGEIATRSSSGWPDRNHRICQSQIFAARP